MDHFTHIYFPKVIWNINIDTLLVLNMLFRYAHSLAHPCFFINIYYPQYTVLHILSHCTSYSFYFIICSLFHSHLYLYIYSLVLCFIVLLLMLFLFYFLFSILLLLLFIYLFIYYFFCTFHWVDLSWPTFHYWLYPVWLCMWQIIKNLEPWTLN